MTLYRSCAARRTRRGGSDDDAIALPLTSVQVSFGAAAYAVPEGGTVDVTVTLSEDPERTVSIPITAANQDGVSDSDYTVPAGVTFVSGDTEETITFLAASDSDNDDGESVKLSFGTKPTAA